MLDYDPTTKLYRVKRVYVPDHILERNIARKQEREKRERGVDEREVLSHMLHFLRVFVTYKYSIVMFHNIYGLYR